MKNLYLAYVRREEFCDQPREQRFFPLHGVRRVGSGVHLGEALDKVRKAEYARLSGKDRRYIKGQKYTLLSRRENLTLEG